MIMADKNEMEVIDLRVVFNKIWSRRKLFYKVLPVVLILSCIYIFSIPRYYTSDTKLAPELGNSMSGGTLGSIASSFGIDLGEMQTSDAITPLLYPDLMEDNKFVAELFNIKVVAEDGEINTTYYDYLEKKQKKAWWSYPISWIKKLFKSKDTKKGGKGEFNPYYLTRKQDGVVNAMRDNILLKVDKKTGVITISATAQDPLIAKSLADSVRVKLQTFITDYRTNKSRIDEQYYKKLVDEAKADYERARRIYGSYADANMDVTLESFRAEQTDLENDMQLKYNTYTTLMTQYQAAKAKVQERTPAFTILKGASVPIKPTGPKRMLFVAGMMLLTLFGTAFWIVRKDLHITF